MCERLSDLLPVQVSSLEENHFEQETLYWGSSLDVTELVGNKLMLIKWSLNMKNEELGLNSVKNIFLNVCKVLHPLDSSADC